MQTIDGLLYLIEVNARVLPGGSQANAIECRNACAVIQQAQVVHRGKKHGLARLTVAGGTAVFNERAKIREKAHNGLAVEALAVHNVRTEGVTMRAETGDRGVLRFIKQDAINRILREIAMDFAEEPVAKRLLIYTTLVVTVAVLIDQACLWMTEGIPTGDKLWPTENATMPAETHIELETHFMRQGKAALQVFRPALDILFMEGTQDGVCSCQADLVKIACNRVGVEERMKIGDNNFHMAAILASERIEATSLHVNGFSGGTVIIAKRARSFNQVGRQRRTDVC